MSLGENIIRLRGEKNLSQERLAAELEVSRQAVSKWETNTSVPELDKLLRMSELFGVTLDELVKGASTSAASQGKTMPVTETEIVHETVIVERQGMSVRMVVGSAGDHDCARLAETKKVTATPSLFYFDR